MAKITAPHPINTRVVGVEFNDGVAEVDDAAEGALAYFMKHNYNVELGTSATPAKAWTVAELLEYADDHALDVPRSGKKAEILEAIREAERDAAVDARDVL